MGRWLLAALLVCSASAAPVLRFDNTALYVSVGVGQNASVQTLQAYNIGGGTLSLSISVPPDAPWITAVAGSPQPCPQSVASATCIPLQLTLATSMLTAGNYSAQVTVSDPTAIDAPQVIVVVVQIGRAIDTWISPGATMDFPLFTYTPIFCQFKSPGCPTATAATQDGGMWLSIALTTIGSSGAPHSYVVRLAPPATMPDGAYTGSVTVTNSGNDGTSPVTMRVANPRQPIAVPSTKRISVRLAQGGPATTYPFLPSISFTNSGKGMLQIQSVTASGTGVSAYLYEDLAIITLDPGPLAPGLYDDGVITIQCNAVNCPIQIPVKLDIVAQGPPLINYQGVADNATFDAWRSVAPGDVAIVTGEQLSLEAPVIAQTFPLPTMLGGSQVLVNGVPAPLYYSSFGQIAFQVPSATAVGTALVQVERDGVPGNTVTVSIVPVAPQILVVTDATYNLINAQHPAKAGDTVILWSIGLGATNPPVPDGVPAPFDPLAVAVTTARVSSTVGPLEPTFAGLSPGYVGLYQVNVQLPFSTPQGSLLLSLDVPDYNGSFGVTIPVQ